MKKEDAFVLGLWAGFALALLGAVIGCFISDLL